MEAKYTMLFNTWLYTPRALTENNYKQEVLEYIVDNSSFDNEMSEELVVMLESVFRYYECGTDDKEEMFNFIKDTFNEHKEYYYEVITNYQKEYDYAVNNKRVISKSDELNIEGSSNIDTTSNNSSTDYELPNKVIPENQYRNTPSHITDNEGTGGQEKTYDNTTTRTSTHTTEFNNEFIDLKNKYMRQIRNVYREFAMKFKDCFYQIY